MNEADMHNEATTDGRMHPPHPKLSSEEKASVDPGIQSSMLNMIKSKFDASDEGKGIIRTMKPSTAKNYANPVLLMCFAGQKAGLTTAEGIIADLIAVDRACIGTRNAIQSDLSQSVYRGRGHVG